MVGISRSAIGSRLLINFSVVAVVSRDVTSAITHMDSARLQRYGVVFQDRRPGTVSPTSSMGIITLGAFVKRKAIAQKVPSDATLR